MELMEAVVADPAAARAMAQAGAGIDAIFDAGIEPFDGRDAIAWIEQLEHLRRRVDAARADLVAAMDRHGLHAADGHANAKAMLRHVGKVSSGEAAGVAKTARAMATLPGLGESYRAGEVGVDQMRLVGKINANPRVAEFVADHDDWFRESATGMPFRDFELVARQWERLVDVDGARDRNERHHDARDFRHRQEPFDLSWSTQGHFGALQGAAIDEILRKYEQAEWEADWEKARAEWGDDATVAHLPRTPAQRRADAFWQLVHDGASAPGSAAAGFVHNIVWDAHSYQQMLDSMSTGEPAQLDPGAHRCSTIDGVPLEPAEAAAASLTAHVRRVLVDAKSVVIDLGTARRFTGSARHATQLQSPECVWPGCHRPTSRCEVDHLTEHSRGGRTRPGNGAPLCGRHNRWKQKGFSVWRDPIGTWHTTRPDGSELN